MQDFDFRHIAPRCGGEREAFEELCCQLARRTLHGNAVFNRLHVAYPNLMAIIKEQHLLILDWVSSGYNVICYLGILVNEVPPNA